MTLRIKIESQNCLPWRTVCQHFVFTSFFPRVSIFSTIFTLMEIISDRRFFISCAWSSLLYSSISLSYRSPVYIHIFLGKQVSWFLMRTHMYWTDNFSNKCRKNYDSWTLEALKGLQSSANLSVIPYHILFPP